MNETLQGAIENQDDNKNPKFLARITNGKDLFNIINKTYAFRTDYDNVENEDEADFIGGFIQTLVDYGDLSGMVEPFDKVKIGYELQKLIEELENKGYFVFGERGLAPMLPEICKLPRKQYVLKVDKKV